MRNKQNLKIDLTKKELNFILSIMEFFVFTTLLFLPFYIFKDFLMNYSPSIQLILGMFLIFAGLGFGVLAIFKFVEIKQKIRIEED